MAKVSYMKGARFTDIASDIGCNPETVSGWARKEGWAEEQLELYPDPESTALATREASILISDSTTQRIDAYHEMLKKGLQTLQEAPVKSAGEACQLIDKAIKGIMAIRQDALQVTFVQDIITVLKSEIPDIDLRRRIAEKLKKICEKYRHSTPE